VASKSDRNLRHAAQLRVDEPVLAAGIFRRVRSSSPVLAPFSGVAALVSSGLGRRRSPGMPRRLLLAVTPMRLHAFGFEQVDGEVVAREELAAWDRAGIVVTAEETAVESRITIEAPGTRVVCTAGDEGSSQAVLRVLRQTAPAPVVA
jgi:hypothetical protein